MDPQLRIYDLECRSISSAKKFIKKAFVCVCIPWISIFLNFDVYLFQ